MSWLSLPMHSTSVFVGLLLTLKPNLLYWLRELYLGANYAISLCLTHRIWIVVIIIIIIIIIIIKFVHPSVFSCPVCSCSFTSYVAVSRSLVVGNRIRTYSSGTLHYIT